ncbi:MAG: DUF3450 domain-containing protein [Desulfovibrio sp.]
MKPHISKNTHIQSAFLIKPSIGILVIAVVVTVFLLGQTVRAEPLSTQPDAQEILSKAITAEANAQKKQNNWEEQRASMLDEIRQLQSENLWLSFQEKKYTRYVTAIEKKIDELNHTKAELERLEDELEPLLYNIVDRLNTQINKDLPFLMEERKHRVEFLNKTLDNHTLSRGEKLRRILEALEVETAYGRNTENTEETVILDGTPTQVTVLRAGRLELYCLTPDQNIAGQYDRSTQGYIKIDPRYIQPLLSLKKMIDQKRVTDFVYLPLNTTNDVNAKETR